MGPLSDGSDARGILERRTQRIRETLRNPAPRVDVRIPFTGETPKQPSDKSLGGFGKNLMSDAWGTVRGLFDFAAWVPKRMWEIAKDTDQYERDFKLLFDMDRSGNIGEVGKLLWETVKEPYKDGLAEAAYNKPFTMVLDIATLLSLGGGSIARMGKFANLPKLVKIGNSLETLPGRLAGKLVKAPLKLVPKSAWDAMGVGEHTPRYMRLLAQAEAEQSIERAGDLNRLLLSNLSDVDAKALHKAIRVGAPEDVAALSPAARERYDFLIKIVGEQEEMFIGRRLLDDKRATAANAKAAAIELFGSADLANSRKALALMKEGKIKPLFASLYVVPEKTLDLFSTLTRDIRAAGKVGRLEKRAARGLFETDPRVYLSRQIQVFHYTKSRLIWLDRIMQDLKGRGLARTLRTGEDVPEGFAVLQDGIFQKYYEDTARSASALVAELRKGKAPEEAMQAAYQKLLGDPEFGKSLAQAKAIAVPRHVAALVARELSVPGPIGRLYDRGLSYWKAAATVFSPRYWLGTAIGNAFLMVLSGAGPFDLVRARKLKHLLPAELRSRAQTEIHRAGLNLYERAASSLGEYSSGLDNILRQGVFGSEVEAARRRLMDVGANFFGFSDNAEEWLRKTALAPGELGAIEVKLQQIEERIALRLPELLSARKELAALDSQLQRMEPHLARLISSEGPMAQREASLTGKVKALEEEMKKLSGVPGELGPVKAVATREIGAQARRGLAGAEKKLARELALERALSTELERSVLAEIRARGGIKPSGGLLEEFRTHVPKSLRHDPKRGPGIAADELADELATRGILPSPYQDELFRWLDLSLARMRTPKMSEADLLARAREFVRGHTRENLGAIVRSVRESIRAKHELVEVRRAMRGRTKALEAARGERAERTQKLEQAFRERQEKLSILESRKAELEAQALADLRESGQLDKLLPELRARAKVAEEAIAAGDRVAGGYLALHPIEKRFFRRLVPFYAFTKAMTLLAFRLPFLWPKRVFAWNRMAEMAADLTQDEDMPSWLADYMPLMGMEDGSLVMVRTGAWNPFGGVTRTGEVIPRQNPLVKLVLELKSDKNEWTKRPLSPGEYATRLDNGEVFKYENGKLRRVIAQPSLWRSLWYLFPQSQIAEELLIPYRMTDRGWMFSPEPIRNPAGEIQYPRELWQALVGLVNRTTKVNLEEEKGKERRRVARVVRSYMDDLKFAPPQEREAILRVLRDYSEGRIRRLEP